MVITTDVFMNMVWKRAFSRFSRVGFLKISLFSSLKLYKTRFENNEDVTVKSVPLN